MLPIFQKKFVRELRDFSAASGSISCSAQGLSGAERRPNVRTEWEHINPTGDYLWRRDGGLRNRKLRPLRSQPLPLKFAS
jgi:hypothetical protein